MTDILEAWLWRSANLKLGYDPKYQRIFHLGGYDMIRTAFFALILTALPATALAQTCASPTKPDIDNELIGDDLTLAGYSSLTKEITTFDQDLASYRNCLSGILNNPDEVSEQDWRTALQANNDIAGLQGEVYADYDRVTAEFMAAQKERAIRAAEQQNADSIKEVERLQAAELERLTSN